METEKSIPIVLGPTGAGKTGLVHRVCLQLEAEIISADSRAVYEHLNIGTATPTKQQQREVPYHLISCIHPKCSYSAMDFREDVESRIKSIKSRDHLPVLVGGSRLYVKALTEGIFEGPGADRELREKLWERESGELHDELGSVDPISAERIHPNDKKRIVRALEVYKLTGKPISRLQEEAEPLPYDFLLVGLNKPREKLYEDIDARVEEMFEEGLAEEVRELLDLGFCESRPSWRTIGYQETVKYLKGELTLKKAKEKIKNNTHQLARKQLGWLRGEDICWIDVERGAEEKAYHELLNLFRKKCLFH